MHLFFEVTDEFLEDTKALRLSNCDIEGLTSQMFFMIKEGIVCIKTTKGLTYEMRKQKLGVYQMVVSVEEFHKVYR